MDLDKLTKLREWMLASGAVRARVGDVELVLGEQPVQALDPDSPWATYLREREGKRPRYTSPEEDPVLYGREPGELPPGLDD